MGFWLMVVLVISGIVLYSIWSGKGGMQREYRDNTQGFSDLLRYATPIDDGVMLGKGGELIAGIFYRGTDTASAANAELEAIAARLNKILSRFGSGWMMHIDAIRGGAIGYMPEGAFISPIARLMDQERRIQYNHAEHHFESLYAIVFTYLPPLEFESKARTWLFERSRDLVQKEKSLRDQIVNKFQQDMNEIEASLKKIFEYVNRMRCHPVKDEAGDKTVIVDDLYAYLRYCVTGIKQNLIRPSANIDADTLIGGQDFIGGNHPKIGEKHIRVISIEGFPSDSFPGILDALNTLPINYRWNTRFIFLDQEEGRGLLDSLRKKWKQKIRGLRDQILNTNSGAADEDAVAMMSDAQTAMSEVASGLVRFGHYTSVVVLMDEDTQKLDQNALACRKLIENLGFSCRAETINAVEAYLGSLPGHGYENVRRPILHSLNLAHLIPTTATWPGLSQHPCHFYPPHSPPLLYAATTGNTPFRLTHHVQDVGHTLVFGPPGSGKSTLLELIAAQHLRYPNANVFKFEKGYSSFALCHAVNGDYYDIASEHQTIAFCPLSRVDEPAERIWAEDYIETLLILQGVEVKPYHRNAVRDALLILANSEADRRSMTDFSAAVQDKDIQLAMQAYTLSGNNAMLDAIRDNLGISRFQVFEMEHLMRMSDRYSVPVLLYLFHCVERRLDGSPTLLILDEAWLMLQHPMFKEKIKEWLKVLRKKNCAVIFATQSVSDVGNSAIRDVVYESCLTKIFLSNASACNDESFEQYRAIGLNRHQIEMIAHATPKLDYYYVSPLGKRMFNLALGPLCLSFVGVSGVEDVAIARSLIAKHKEKWVVEWLRHCLINKPWGSSLHGWINQLEKEFDLAA